MELSTSREEGVVVVEPAGRLDKLSAGELQQQLAELIRDGELRIVIDLGMTEHIDGAGLRALLNLSKRLETMDGNLVLCAMGNEVRRAFRLAGFIPLFSIVPSRADAVNELADDETLARVAELANRLLAVAEQRDIERLGY